MFEGIDVIEFASIEIPSKIVCDYSSRHIEAILELWEEQKAWFDKPKIMYIVIRKKYGTVNKDAVTIHL